jgi:ABC-type glutathione transport system ATPase component
MSGGQCQRVMIAMALAANPSLLIADEPTTGLDVTTQAAIMRLLRDAAGDRQMSTVLITHDLALASESCDRIAVMHAGHIVEVAPTRELFAQPAPSLHGGADSLGTGQRRHLGRPGLDSRQPARSARARSARVPLRRALRAGTSALP